MELVNTNNIENIEKLLEKYLEATTTVREEQVLQAYFSQSNVAPHLQEYQPMFQYFSQLQGEQYTRNVPLKTKRNYFKWISVAAVVLLASGLFLNHQKEQQEAEAAYADFKNVMTMVSENFNFGASHLNHLAQYEETTNRIFITENN